MYITFIITLHIHNSIDWAYNIVGEYHIPYYEGMKTRAHPKQLFELVLTREKRMDMLQRDWDIETSDLIRAVRRNVRAKNQRRTTVNNLKHAPWEWMWECTCRKVKRVVFCQRSVDQQVQDLLSQVEQRRG